MPAGERGELGQLELRAVGRGQQGVVVLKASNAAQGSFQCGHSELLKYFSKSRHFQGYCKPRLNYQELSTDFITGTATATPAPLPTRYEEK